MGQSSRIAPSAAVQIAEALRYLTDEARRAGYEQLAQSLSDVEVEALEAARHANAFIHH